ncbi:hypothetical protein [Silvanigrella aquatica]|uniref:LepB N-terminal domain-containing protein n=1 Tax=Silvanigrella aquatica TaxID=1915309 RepID=A0A1L4D2B1_9BACT|nr:hypothetical protein [Silvanigrella aquatica]APJ04345.1 hypothetical protein AXG55_10680 [Silvanigrella aquatica]
MPIIIRNILIIFFILPSFFISCGRNFDNKEGIISQNKNKNESNFAKIKPAISKDKIIFPDDISKYEKKSGKIGGQKAKEDVTGIYSINLNGKNYTLLFKQGRNDGENIAELIASRLYDAFLAEHGAHVILAKRHNTIVTQNFVTNDLHTEIFIGSVFFDEFREIFKILNLNDRPKIIPKDKMASFVKTFYSSNLGEVLAASLWLGDYDIHIGNIGIAKVANKADLKYGYKYDFVKIDHGWSFAYLQNQMNYKSTPWGVIKALALSRPTSHFNDYDIEDFLRNKNGSFRKKIDNLKYINKDTIRRVLTESFNELNKYYNPIAYKSFAQWIGYSENQEVNSEKIINYLTEKLYNRAQNGLID